MAVKDNARLDYELGMKYKDIAEKYGISINTIRSWKTRGKWERNKKLKKDVQNDAQKEEKNAHQNEKDVQSIAVEKSVNELNASRLTERQKRFCLLYLKNLNATQSYIDVYDVDYKTASVNGPRMLGNARVKKLLDKLKDEISQELYLNVQDIASNYAKIAFSDYGKFIKWHSYEEKVLDSEGDPALDNNGNELKRHYVDIAIADMDKVDTSLIKSVSKGKDGLKLELYDKMKASQELMKYFANDKFNVDDKEASPLEQLLDKVERDKME